MEDKTRELAKIPGILAQIPAVVSILFRPENRERLMEVKSAVLRMYCIADDALDEMTSQATIGVALSTEILMDILEETGCMNAGKARKLDHPAITELKQSIREHLTQ